MTVVIVWVSTTVNHLFVLGDSDSEVCLSLYLDQRHCFGLGLQNVEHNCGVDTCPTFSSREHMYTGIGLHQRNFEIKQ